MRDADKDIQLHTSGCYRELSFNLFMPRYGTKNVRPGVSFGRHQKTTASEGLLLNWICLDRRGMSTSVLRERWQERIRTQVSRGTGNKKLLSLGLRAGQPAN